MGMDSLIMNEEDEFKHNVTVNHLFFGKFRVTTLITRMSLPTS